MPLLPPFVLGDAPLWRPSADRVAHANLTRFARAAAAHGAPAQGDYADLYKWSIADPAALWTAVWQFTGVVASERGATVIDDRSRMPGARFFPDARLNYAENLLQRRDHADAIVFWGENQVRRRLSHASLYDEVSRCAQALSAAGVRAGDRVAGYLPNMPETIVAALATASLGAIWSSASPDFGVQGVLDRFGQIGPKVLVSADGYFYNGRRFDCVERLPAIMAGLPTVQRVVIVPYTQETLSDAALAGVPHAVSWSRFVASFDAATIRFAQLPFNHPLAILFTSGTTGVPKCIVHGAGGTLLQHLKEHQLHSDIRPGDRVFYFTSCGWMMWNWLVTALASGATLLLYDGSPFFPSENVLFDMADAEGMTFFGTSARFIAAVEKAGLAPIETHRLSTLRTMASTGSPLLAESFAFVYERIKVDVHLASISGGTDIVSCFALGNPIGPVWAGELQTAGLGMRVEVYDDTGRPVRGQKGELVCSAPFPSMPIGFWDDPGDRRYRAAYFEKFPGVWCHGDYAEVTSHGGFVIYGRSDAVLNPGGVRIGTAEIYRQVESFDEVLESVVVAQQWQGDQRVVLFVRVRPGVRLDADLVDRIKTRIRQNTSPRHVPAKIVPVDDIPRTKSNKLVEIAVREIIHGRPVPNVEALANPEALAQYRDRPELRD